ncbi:MAG: DUF4242 domain-containing protein [Betaproteobacteria bacterium HGW-Betaproteobacteria-4]|jgi:hypothetical protein|nr:MAG: DUF4242 domain-containing protein [Betaproteobacteria bacterium HGW-Betaproteobacteria-4]
MQAMRYFLDTHDRARGTFPAQLSPEEFEVFFAQYEAACQAEGVIPLRTHVGFAEGRAFCLNLAPDAESVRRAHERVGLPYDDISEITTATPGDTFFRRRA